MALTDREQQIVALLRRDPLMSPATIADQLGTTRTAVNVHLSNLGKKGVILGRGYILGERPGVVVVGGANVDIKAVSRAQATAGTSNPGRSTMSPGGVGRNVAENLARLGVRTHLVTAVGRDALGEDLMRETLAAGVLIEHVHRTALPTGTYTAVLDRDGELIVAVADMAAVESLQPEHVNASRDVISAAGLLVLDGNLPAAALHHARDLAAAAGVRTILEPVSVPKAALLAPTVTADLPLYAITPNRDELAALTALPVRTDRQVRVAATALHRRGVEHVWVRLGRRGSLLSTDSSGAVELPAVPAEVHDVTGAGDSMLAAFCYALLDGHDPVLAASYGHAAAALTIASPHTVRPDLTPRLIQAALTSHHQENP